ncbi:hypothetical protein K461DRAFT_292650 [Myriangium duriaei CBS 260.36]|uniref:Uncharacterized protein n=1 Tax=Myriangium duriaei CBS 260.36 TaxID=1168546 RepID=A0A9P4MI65_9PEZI|nr:hypothetical protein K461DRAFT_292650 [Myriangium duriaei CBS 260.36]
MQPTAARFSRAVRRLPLTSKQAGANYYKGYGGGAMGRHTKHGGYVIEWEKVRTYRVPDLKGFHMTPFVSKRITKGVGSYVKDGTESLEVGDKAADWEQGPLSGARWVREWQEAREAAQEIGVEGPR